MFTCGHGAGGKRERKKHFSGTAEKVIFAEVKQRKVFHFAFFGFFFLVSSRDGQGTGLEKNGPVRLMRGLLSNEAFKWRNGKKV